jgi:hypothetical protein
VWRASAQWEALRRTDTRVLVGLLAAATPIGLAGYSLVSGNTIFLARNLSASVTAILLLLGAAFAAMPRRTGLAAGAVVLLTVGVGAVKTLDPDTRRPPLEQAARYIDAHARRGDPVIDFAFKPSSSFLSRRLQIYFDRPHPVHQAGYEDALAWRAAARGRRVFMVLTLEGFNDGIPRASGPGARFPLIGRSPLLRGSPPVVVLQFARASVEARRETGKLP